MSLHSTLAAQVALHVPKGAEPRLQRLDGVAGGTASADTAGGLSGAANSDRRVQLLVGCVGWLPRQRVALAAAGTQTAGDMGWVVGLAPGGRPYLTWCEADGLTRRTVVAPDRLPFAGSTRYLVRELRVDLDLNDGAGNHVVAFSWRVEGGAWQLLAEVTTAGVTTMASSASAASHVLLPSLNAQVGGNAAAGHLAACDLYSYTLANLADAVVATTGDLRLLPAGSTVWAATGSWAGTLALSDWSTHKVWAGASGTERVQVTRGGRSLLDGLQPGTWALQLQDQARTLEGAAPMRHTRLIETYDGAEYPLARGYLLAMATVWADAGGMHLSGGQCVDGLQLMQATVPAPLEQVMARLAPDHWWKLDEASGSAAADSGNAATLAPGTYSAGVTLADQAWNDGGTQLGALFDGSSKVTIASAPATALPTGDCTVSMFVRPAPTSDVASAVRRLVGTDAADALVCAVEAGSDTGWASWGWAAGHAGQAGGGADTGRVGTSGAVVVGDQADGAGRWRHLAFVRSGGVWAVHLDGQQWGQPWQPPAAPASAVSTLYLGGDADTGGTVGGSAAGGYSILWVAGDAPLGSWHGSKGLTDWVEAQGHAVTYVDIATLPTAAAAAAAAAGFDLVVIDSSMTTTELTTQFRNLAQPVLSFEPHFAQEQGLSANSGYFDRSGTQLTISAPSHPLANGLAAGNHTVYSSTALSDGVLVANDVVQVAHQVGQTSVSLIAACDTGGTMADGDTAPNRRVHFYWNYNSSGQRNATAEGLFAAAIDWAANVVVPTPGVIGTKAGASYEGHLAHVAIWGTALDGGQLEELAAARLGGSLAAERTDLRISRLLDWVGWPVDRRDLSQGRETMPVRVLQGGETVLALLAEAVAAEGTSALLYQDGAGVVVFKGRNWAAEQSAELRCGDLPAHLADNTLRLAVAAPATPVGSDLRGSATGTAAGGSGVQVRRTGGSGDRDLALGTLQHVDDATTAEHVQAALNRHGSAASSVSQVLLQPHLDGRLWLDVLAMAPGMRASMAQRPQTASGAVERVDWLTVVGLTHVVGHRHREVVLQTAPARQVAATIVGTSRVGVDTAPAFTGD